MLTDEGASIYRPGDNSWTSPDETCRLICGEALDQLRWLPDGSVDAIVTDPPYSSGGFTRGDRVASPHSKYVHSNVQIWRPTFAGDGRSAFGWHYWMALWVTECQRIVKDSGYLLSFSDWRQLAICQNAIEAGGFVVRGIVAWNKGEGARAPNTGHFRHQCEYIVYATNGVSRPARHKRPLAGCLTCPVGRTEKLHLTGKPVRLMEHLVQVAPPGGLVLDPFAGAATTGVACLRTGRRFLGIERTTEYFAIGEQRLKGEMARMSLEGRAAC